MHGTVTIIVVVVGNYGDDYLIVVINYETMPTFDVPRVMDSINM